MTEDTEPKGDVPEDEHERWDVLIQLEEWLERPILVLSFIWTPRRRRSFKAYRAAAD